MSFPLPFTAQTLIHQGYTSLVSSSDFKYEVIDASRIPYIARYNPAIPYLLAVADESGFIRFFKTKTRLNSVKELRALNCCIYDLKWLTSSQLACGGGDNDISIYDVEKDTRLSLLKGHTASVKSITSQPLNPFVLATGSRDGSILIFDTRCNRHICVDPGGGSQGETYSIKSVNQIQMAHCDPDPKTKGILKTRQQHSVSSPSTTRKPIPLSCVVYQNESSLVSAGTTDGFIKIWDTRKTYINHVGKKGAIIEHSPMYSIDHEIVANYTQTCNAQTKRGFSNLVISSDQTRLYSNCMNSSIYEYNLTTCNPRHTRSVNKTYGGGTSKHYNQNNSNFIKSSLSPCGSYILTGSSDSNAYIYSTDVNSHLKSVRKHMPVIVLKGHTGEVTTVDWNPFDPNQICTCADDNTIRVWNVRRELEKRDSDQIDFVQAEIATENSEESSIDSFNLDDRDQFTSRIRTNHIIYNKNRPNFTGVYDDPLFINYEFKRYMKARPQAVEMDLENELCMKCESINLDLKLKATSLESEMERFADLKSFLSALPINLIDESTSPVLLVGQPSGMRRQQHSLTSLAVSVFSQLSQAPSIKTKTPKPKSTKTSKPTESKTKSLLQKLEAVMTPGGKKRNMKIECDDQSNGSVEDLVGSTPKAKKRLLAVSENTHNKSILDYFSPKPTPSK